ncbi:hypothetical protein [Pseudodonghicola xiamenensis]|uniref:Uncharacterized protein n=1 Tax=Pseudodonghicola xiamenensis TaxID=337702 RepID=A0A8J3MAQ2_9RHOB|nr:hypothetical protein [Pseudodonghicola xiamenensis]GHG79231.1 hypothetical protein GCM10010961_00960 [Pseudodonghicola xiamenensis]
MILSIALVTGCTQVGGLKDRVNSGLTDFTLLDDIGGMVDGRGTTAARARAAEAAQTAAPLVTELPETPPVAAVPQAANGRLGATVASLGDPGKAGLWLETPLVKTAGKGRVVWPSSGRWIAVALLPASGEVTAGSRLSLDGFRALGAPLTDLIEVEVYAGD